MKMQMEIVLFCCPEVSRKSFNTAISEIAIQQFNSLSFYVEFSDNKSAIVSFVEKDNNLYFVIASTILSCYSTDTNENKKNPHENAFLMHWKNKQTFKFIVFLHTKHF